jgi:ATP-dependent Lhr-like helicase
VQQILSAIAEFGAVRAEDLWRLLCATEPFAEVSKQQLVEALRSMGNEDLITQCDDGSLMLGGKGERIVNHYAFYAAFATAEEFRIMVGSRTLGTMPVLVSVTEEQYIIFAGRRWRVVAIDTERKVLEVEAAAAGRAPLFVGCGQALVDDRVREEMLGVYLGSDVPAYLDARAVELLGEGRTWFRQYGLDKRRALPYGDSLILFPWVGDRAMNALALMLVPAGLQVAQDGVAISVRGASLEELGKCLRQALASGPPDPADLAKVCPIKKLEKYHWCLSDALLHSDYARSMIDVERAWSALADIASGLR